mmetsp:Transcript_99566/g.321006  ORF Transcript_99566/g.321006 Transcript_99566/m.321006 type:complete len:225 (-) Transcript_99566:507-1181(-)
MLQGGRFLVVLHELALLQDVDRLYRRAFGVDDRPLLEVHLYDVRLDSLEEVVRQLLQLRDLPEQIALHGVPQGAGHLLPLPRLGGVQQLLVADGQGPDLVGARGDLVADGGAVDQPLHAEELAGAEAHLLLARPHEVKQRVLVHHLHGDGALLNNVEPRGDVVLPCQSGTLGKPLSLQRLRHSHLLRRAQRGEQRDAGEDLRPSDDAHLVEVLIPDSGQKVATA